MVLRKPSSRPIRFSNDISIHEVKPYSKVFGLHPWHIVIVSDAHDTLRFARVPVGCDPFTGRPMSTMDRRRKNRPINGGDRQEILRGALEDGAAWEVSTISMINAISKQKKFVQKRLGAKAVKSAEKLLNSSEELTGEAATMYRALSARINYLAQDRPDLAYCAKELCRDFSKPTSKSVEKLKRAGRYLCHHPRMVWHFEYQTPDDAVDVYCDTDFAGCQQTRRSTSGGCIMHGAHLLKHWSTTQTTIALSSAEAELGGICKGASQGLGMRSLLQDLGLKWKLRIHSDAAAAIGICRRRGLGKVRHLAVADLWVQDHLRTKDFELLKVLGADNPADALTKPVEHPCLSKHVKKMSLRCEEGRAASAPKLDG